MNKKLVFFDIDGTLVSHVGKSHVPEPTAEAVKRLRQNGHTPAIATARNLALTRKTAAFFGIDLLVCCNGAYVARGDDDIRDTYLDEGFTGVFRAEAFSVSPNAYALDIRNVYTEMNEDYFEAFILDQAGYDCKKNLAAIERVQLAYIFAPLPDRWRGHEGVETIETPRYTEFRPPRVSKWSGIVAAAAAAGFDLGDVVTVGDGLNDIEMVRNAPLGLAVGAANTELKAVADLVTEDIDQGGILSAFLKLDMI
ncbi:MAG: Cof-type HAD-IIB family hydrolase [Synergistaceae bacterium]|jgi:Cof subfamily protein (haloacid dehalogenase superfamily)|nr:Cof-type HAD-IIB family hydrolase [Synergistaceae bacterium]